MPAFNKIAALAACVALPLISACEPKRIVTALPIPPERMDCVYVAKRPTIPPEHRIDWSKVTTVAQAKGEHDAFVRSIRTREGIVAGYLVSLEGRLFQCANDAAWVRAWSDATR